MGTTPTHIAGKSTRRPIMDRRRRSTAGTCDGPKAWGDIAAVLLTVRITSQDHPLISDEGAPYVGLPLRRSDPSSDRLPGRKRRSRWPRPLRRS